MLDKHRTKMLNEVKVAPTNRGKGVPHRRRLKLRTAKAEGGSLRIVLEGVGNQSPGGFLEEVQEQFKDGFRLRGVGNRVIITAPAFDLKSIEEKLGHIKGLYRAILPAAKDTGVPNLVPGSAFAEHNATLDDGPGSHVRLSALSSELAKIEHRPIKRRFARRKRECGPAPLR